MEAQISPTIDMRTERPSRRQYAVFTAISETEPHSFRLNHPKNYFGVPVAVAMDDPVELLVQQELVAMAGEAATGAEVLGLITRDKTLTPAGAAFVESVVDDSKTVEDVFEGIATSTRSRLIEAVPEARSGVQQAVSRYPAASEVISILDEHEALSLAELAEIALLEATPSLVRCLFAGDQTATGNDAGDHDRDLEDTDTYNSLFTSQFKSILYHSGVVTNPGSDTTRLSPTDDIWALSPVLDDGIASRAIAADNGGEW